MASERHAVVDLTDDTNSPDPSNFTRFDPSSDPSRSSYVPSALNPAKRSRVEPPNLNPLALLNPRAYVANGSTPSDIQTFSSRPREQNRATLSLNQHMEAIHGVKDRKTKTPTPKEVKRDIPTTQDRQSGNNLSEGVDNGTGPADVIDLTGCYCPPLGKV
jgi:hypothetical protein